MQPENAALPIETNEVERVIVAKAEQLPNAVLPIEITLFGIVIEIRLSQSQNALFPILVQFEFASNVTLAKFGQLPKAPSPIVVTEFKMVNEVKPEPQNILSLRAVTVFGSVIEFKLVQPWKTLVPTLIKLEFASNVTLAKFEQIANAPLHIVVTEFKIVNEVKDEQLLNTHSLKTVTVLGKSIASKFAQLSNACSPILVQLELFSNVILDI